MSDLAADADYLLYQYSTATKLRIRQEAHERYSEGGNDFFDWILDHLALGPGQQVVDAGCGNGGYLQPLHARGCHIVGVDASFGMVTAARAAADAAGIGAVFIQAQIEHLPLASSSFDRAMANHMLYHVPDQMAALRELRRVLKPGGIMLCATNAAGAGGVLFEAHIEAAAALGYQATAPMTDRFHLGHLELVRTVFPSAQVDVRREAFVFPSVEPALRYYTSGMVDMLADAPADNGHRAPMLAAVAQHLTHIEERDGVIRVPKDAGCFVARME